MADKDQIIVEGVGEEKATDSSSGLSEEDVTRLRTQYGFNELVEEEINPFLKFLSYFWGPMPIMIWLAILIELIKASIKGDGWPDFGVLVFLQIVNGCVGYVEERNAGNAIAALKQKLAPQCVVKRDGRFLKIPSRELVPGDFISLKLGDIIPADCILLDGQPVQVDQSALTGESLPKTLHPGQKALMGSSLKRGEIDAIVCGTGSNTFFGKAADLMNIGDTTGRFQKILFKITLALLALSLLLCSVIFIKLILTDSKDQSGEKLSTGDKFLSALSVVIVLLVASIPIAMQVVCTSTMAVGSRRLAQKKVIVARLSAIEELAGMTILCSDKTGTLTKNQLSLRPPILMEGPDACNEEELTFYAALAARHTKDTQDAIDKCVCEALSPDQLARIQEYEVLDFFPFNPNDKRTEATVRCPADASNPMPQIMKITKGAPQVILRMAHNYEEICDQVDIMVQQLADRGFRALGLATCYVVEDQPDRWEFQGLMSLFDPPRDDTKHTIEQAIHYGVEVKMVTGDQTAIAKETCRELGMGTNILNTDVLSNPVELGGSSIDDLILNSNGFAEVFPEHKFEIVDRIRKRGFVTGMTGDGVNDAPALKRADIGIAVEGATDAAKAAADIVLTEPGLGVIIDAILRSRKIFQRMRNYCIYRIACTIQLLCFFFFAVLTVNPYSDVFYGDPDPARNTPDTTCNPDQSSAFTLPVISLVVITILNDGTIITIARDKVVPGMSPQKWDLNEVVVVSTVLGLVACLSSMIILVLAMEANCTNSNVTWLGNLMLPGSNNVVLNKNTDSPIYVAADSLFLSFDQVKTVMYLKVSLSDFLTVFSARCRGFFWERRPGLALGVAFGIATLCSTLLACYWDDIFGLDGLPSEIMIGLHSFPALLTIWVYCILWFFIQDAFKVLTYYILENFIRTEHKERLADLNRVAFASRLVDTDAKAYRARGIGHQASIARQTTMSNVMTVGGPDHQRLQARVDQLERELSRFHQLEHELHQLRQIVNARQQES